MRSLHSCGKLTNILFYFFSDSRNVLDITTLKEGGLTHAENLKIPKSFLKFQIKFWKFWKKKLTKMGFFSSSEKCKVLILPHPDSPDQTRVQETSRIWDV